jgi:DNA-binding NtrC family response regulator
MNSFNKLKKLKTLLVDDDELIRDSLKIAFSAKGCAMRVAENAEEGLKEFIEKPFSVKVLVNLLALAIKHQERNRAAVAK